MNARGGGWERVCVYGPRGRGGPGWVLRTWAAVCATRTVCVGRGEDGLEAEV